MDKRKLAAAARDGFALERTKLSELIATFIQETVTSGKLKVGDRLPPERQLARDFKVNRATVREGMHLLWERGLVERKNRRGTRIVSMKPSTVGAAIERYFVLSNCRHRDLHEIRSVLEPKSAALAATNANEEDLNKLKELVKELDECWKLEGARQLASADVRFHLALASASHNALMIAIFSGLTPVLEKFLFIQHAEIRRPESFLMHREVYEAVVDRDPARAAQVMARHMETTPIFGSKPSSSLHQHRAGLTASYTAAAEGS